jgi:hypothetical protein
VPEQRREREPGQEPELPSCCKRPVLRLQPGSPKRAISSFQGFLLWGEKQFPEIVSADQMAALTEQQGLELLLFSPKLYAEKNQGFKP